MTCVEIAWLKPSLTGPDITEAGLRQLKVAGVVVAEGEAVGDIVLVAVGEAEDGVVVSPAWSTVKVMLALRGVNRSDALIVCCPVFQL